MTAERCNEFGVYEPDEVLTLERGVKGWRGLPTAEIKLRDLGTHWIWASCFQLMHGDHAGHASPLTDHPAYRAKDRKSALYAAKAYLLKSLDERAKEPGDARRILIWIDTLDPAQGSLFG